MLLLERFDRTSAVAATLAGWEGGEDLIDPQPRLDALLIAEPAQIDPEKAELMDALGLSRG